VFPSVNKKEGKVYLWDWSEVEKSGPRVVILCIIALYNGRSVALIERRVLELIIFQKLAIIRPSTLLSLTQIAIDFENNNLVSTSLEWKKLTSFSLCIGAITIDLSVPVCDKSLDVQVAGGTPSSWPQNLKDNIQTMNDDLYQDYFDNGGDPNTEADFYEYIIELLGGDAF
jgi:hypothetical protein